VALKQETKLREFLQVVDGDWADLEAAPTLCQNQTLRRESAQDFTQRADTDAVVFLQGLQAQFLSRSQRAKNDVRADAAITIISNSLNLFQTVHQHHQPIALKKLTVEVAQTCRRLKGRRGRSCEYIRRLIDYHM